MPPGRPSPLSSTCSRSSSSVLTLATPDKALRPTRSSGEAVEIMVASDVEDEARRIVDRIKALGGWDDRADRRLSVIRPYPYSLGDFAQHTE
jgi:hypothetical protein